VPKSVETSHKGKVNTLWTQQVQTDTTILNNKPDITILRTEKRARTLTDFEISGDTNMIKKEAEKITDYTDLTIEIQRMRNVKTNVLSVIIVAMDQINADPKGNRYRLA
jgi:hypothetical protein